MDLIPLGDHLMKSVMERAAGRVVLTIVLIRGFCWGRDFVGLLRNRIPTDTDTDTDADTDTDTDIKIKGKVVYVNIGEYNPLGWFHDVIVDKEDIIYTPKSKSSTYVNLSSFMLQ